MNLVISDGVEIKTKDEGERKDIGLVVLRGKSVQSLRVLESFKKPLPQ